MRYRALLEIVDGRDRTFWQLAVRRENYEDIVLKRIFVSAFALWVAFALNDRTESPGLRGCHQTSVMTQGALAAHSIPSARKEWQQLISRAPDSGTRGDNGLVFSSFHSASFVEEHLRHNVNSAAAEPVSTDARSAVKDPPAVGYMPHATTRSNLQNADDLTDKLPEFLPELGFYYDLYNGYFEGWDEEARSVTGGGDYAFSTGRSWSKEDGVPEEFYLDALESRGSHDSGGSEEDSEAEEPELPDVVAKGGHTRFYYGTDVVPLPGVLGLRTAISTELKQSQPSQVFIPSSSPVHVASPGLPDFSFLLIRHGFSIQVLPAAPLGHSHGGFCSSLCVALLQGFQALGKPNLRRKLPLLAVSMFLVGMGLETAMCLSGFYSVYTVNEAKKKAEEEVKEEEFWQRVRDRRAARQGMYTSRRLPPLARPLLLICCFSNVGSYSPAVTIKSEE
ncbi:hypothetical protein BESB_030880 [Besnoitia besnoiti]|uniref:Transmembrane protein n=1 Tax=Besnoitia besnoiti TaxID=94643 RepID=A0A2A9M1U4_BESBE|nr:hypothetical protein BESB_030880 [Besnoitia besnoiti]PFH31214.1 hypothetical protein BESB_030880 [Besnoitia besnoiti]